MDGPVRLTRDGAVAVIEIDNPPVNALGAAVRQGLLAAIERLDADPDLAAAVIYGAGRSFPAGADISEFGKPPVPPRLPDLCDRIEAATKPIVASLHGTALGGGLEIALAAHRRIAQPGARIGLPEVHLGIIPGAGGTQRAPRLAGWEAAAEMILSGRHIPAAEALELGLIDAIDDTGDPRAAGIALAAALAGTAPRRTGAITPAPPPPGWFDAARARAAARAPGQANLPACIDAIEGALLPIAEGMRHERAIYTACHDHPQRAALVHAFFAERAVARIPERAAPRPIVQIGVIGGGTMGAGIAAAALNAGLPFTLVERDAPALAQAEANLRRCWASAVKKGRMTEAAVDTLLAERASLRLGLEALAPCDVIIEAIYEDLPAKQQVFAALDRVAKPGAILASNTSYLDLDAIAAAVSRPADVIGLHFFSPAHVMRLLEVVVGAASAPDAVATGFALAKRMKKVAVRAGNGPGFIGNRILRATMHAACLMVEDGAAPWQVDAALRGFGAPMGPFQTGDLAGLDIGYAGRRAQDAGRDPARRYPAGFLDRIVEAGFLGRKTGAGIYSYAEGLRPAPPNPEIVPLIASERRRKGLIPQEFSEQEILARHTAAATNAAAQLLEERIALRPLDIDMVLIFGYGYPRLRGGPMHHADTVGPAKILADIRRFAPEDPDFWAPAPLLERLAATGGRFADLNGA